MLATFRRIAKANGMAYVRLNEGENGWDLRSDRDSYFETKRSAVEKASDSPGIFFNFHSDIPDLTRCKDECGARGIHVVRDPRDLLISGARFHLVADEAWLHEPMPEYGGMTYQQKLLSYETMEDRIKFEMDHHMGQVIRDMDGFDDQGVFQRVQYEDLIVDRDMVLFHQLLVHLGMQGRALIHGLDAFWKSSLFGERSEHDLKATRNHIFDSRLKQWADVLTPSTLELIESRFEREILGLGYALSSSACLG